MCAAAGGDNGSVTQTSRASGCRTFTFAVSRAARPADASARMAPIASSSAGSAAAPCSRRYGAKCTDSPVRAWCIQSVTNGVNGASRRHDVTSTSCSVANAARLSSVSTSYTRRLASRTYHFDTSSSRNDMMARAALVAS